MITDYHYTETQISSATFSDCRSYRYELVRNWDFSLPRKSINFLMLNPSTADAFKNDPTVERCQRRAIEWGFTSMVITNIFAFRSTNPKGLRTVSDPVGPANDHFITNHIVLSSLVVCAWGTHGVLKGRSAAVQRRMAQLNQIGNFYHLGLTQKGHPRHPLFVPYSQKMVSWKELYQ